MNNSGQILIDASLSVKDVIYSALWYKCDTNTMKDIRFMLARSQIPLPLAALPLGDLGFPLFLAEKYYYVHFSSPILKKRRKMIFDALNKTPFYVCFQILKYTSNMPFEGQSEKSFFLISILVKPFLAIIWLGELVHVSMTIKNKSGVNIAEDIALIFSTGGFILSNIIFSFNYKRWLRHARQVTDFSKFGKPPTFDRAQRDVNFHSAVMCVYALIATVFYMLKGYLDTSACKRKNEEKHLKEVCAITPFWLPGETVSDHVLYSIDLLQLFDATVIYSSGSTLVFLVYNVVMMIRSHLMHLKVLLIEALEEEDLYLKRDKLRFCVNYHIHIYELGTELGYLSKLTTGNLTLSTAICMSCLGNQIITERSVRATMHLIGYVVGTFVIANSGQILIDDSLSLKDAIYSSLWYKCDANTMRDIRFMLARSQIPLRLEAFPLGNLSYPFFLAVMKTAYSYVTVLHRAT